jgi:hypothetical protein
MAINYAQWLERLRSLATDLASRGYQVQLKIGDPIPEDELASEESYFAQAAVGNQFVFHPALRRLYAATRLVTFYWHTGDAPGIASLSGALRLRPLAMLYETDPGVDPGGAWHGVWRILDEVTPVAHTVIRFDEIDGAATLAWRSTESGEEVIIPLAIDVDEYFQLALATCCLSNWQLLFIADPDELTDEQREDLLTTLEDLEPSADLTTIRGRLGLP